MEKTTSKPKLMGFPLPTSTIRLLRLYGNIMVYAMCSMAQVPVLPYLTKKLGANNAQYAALQTIFSTVQFIGGLISGPFVDAYGGQALLLVSFFASVATFSMTALATSIPLLYVSRVPTVLQHAVLAARTIVTDISREEDRAKYLSYIGVAYGVGFAVGPVIGGMMSEVSLTLPAWVAAAASLLCILSVAFWPPPGSNKPPQSKRFSRQKKKTSTSLLQPFYEVSKQPRVPSLLAVKVLAGLGVAVFQSMFSVVLQRHFGLTSKQNGQVLSYVGVIAILAQALFVDWSAKMFGEATSVHVTIWGLLLSFVALACAKHLWQMLLLFIPLTACGTVFGALNTAQLTKAVPSSSAGTVLAVDMSLGSGVRMLSPATGAWLLARYGYPGMGWAAAALLLLLLVLIHSGAVHCGLEEHATDGKKTK